MTLKQIERTDPEWADYCRVARQSFDVWDEAAGLHRPWNPNDDQPLNDQAYFVFLKEDDAIVGICGIQHTDHDIVYIENVAIQYDQRGRNLGLRMLEDFKNMMAGRYDGALLDCNSSKEAFYKKAGYETLEEKASRPDFIRMAKRWRPLRQPA